jgi:hypothetical protein
MRRGEAVDVAARLCGEAVDVVVRLCKHAHTDRVCCRQAASGRSPTRRRQECTLRRSLA